jgi:hypothetical protein
MGVFHTTEELIACFGALYEQARQDPRVGPGIQQAGVIVRFRYSDPTAVVTINAATAGAQPPDGFFAVIWREVPELKPTIEMSMSADIAHQFWLGKVNLVAALTRRQIIAKGPISKILKLLPLVTPLYEIYPQILRGLGRDDLVY